MWCDHEPRDAGTCKTDEHDVIASPQKDNSTDWRQVVNKREETHEGHRPATMLVCAMSEIPNIPPPATVISGVTHASRGAQSIFE